MKLTINRTELIRELRICNRVIEKKTSIPVLSHALILAYKGGIVITATDLELSIRCICPASVAEPGTALLPLRKFVDLLGSLTESKICVEAGEDHAATITCGRSRTRMAGMSRENFPELPKTPAVLAQIPAAMLAGLIARTAFAISNEGSRYTQNGGLLVLKPDTITMVSTDGHRLAFIEAQHGFDGISGQLRALVPKKALLEIQKLAAEAQGASVGLSSDENNLFFQFGKRLLITRKLTGQFPDYERVLPRENERTVIVNRNEMAAAIRRVSQFADERSHAIRVAVAPGELKLASSGSESGESEESLPVEGSAGEMQIGFNAQYLLDFLGAVTAETVQLDLKDERSGVMMRPVNSKQPAALLPVLGNSDDDYDYRYLVIPLRI